jgi:hypothetical protein
MLVLVRPTGNNNGNSNGNNGMGTGNNNGNGEPMATVAATTMANGKTTMAVG